MKPDMLDHAWVGLIALSCGSAIVASSSGSGLSTGLAGVLIVLLALMKARLILAHYLGLSEAPTWRRGFNLSLTLFCLCLLGLYFLPGIIS